LKKCATCANNQNCLTCSDSNRLSAPNCICKDGFYDPVTAALCIACSHPCKKCSSPTICLSCDSALKRKLDQTTCICIDGYYESNSVCL
jgi:hypothetical protein